MKKIISFFLVVSMLAVIFPITNEGFVLETYAISESGSCGSGVTYSYDSTTKQVVISGNGSIGNYGDSYNQSPFQSKDIESIVINNGITAIGTHAFYRCTKLKSVTIPESVKYISEGAFAFCSNLESILVPNSVTEIGIHAFSSCINLKEIMLSNNISVIADSTFYGCKSLNKNTTVGLC